MSKDKMNGQHHPDAKMELQAEMQVKVQTVQYASQIVLALVQTRPAGTPAADIAAEAFAISEAFDVKAQEYLRPPTIHKPPAGLVLT